MVGILNITGTKLLTYYLTLPALNISIRVSGWNVTLYRTDPTVLSIILIHWLEEYEVWSLPDSPDYQRFIFIREFLIFLSAELITFILHWLEIYIYNRMSPESLKLAHFPEICRDGVGSCWLISWPPPPLVSPGTALLPKWFLPGSGSEWLGVTGAGGGRTVRMPTLRQLSSGLALALLTSPHLTTLYWHSEHSERNNYNSASPPHTTRDLTTIDIVTVLYNWSPSVSRGLLKPPTTIMFLSMNIWEELI